MGERKEKVNLHAGHRQRVKERFLEHGERVFDDYQLLELLLFYGVPRRDTNPLAHQLMNRFGSLAGVLNASPEALRKIPGLNENAMVLLHLMPQLMRRYQQSEIDRETIITSISDAADYLEPYFFGLQIERVYLLSGDNRGRVLGCELLGEGGALAVGLDTRRLTEIALRHRASWVILAHSHPSGLAVPSGDDILTTLNCRDILRPLGIALRDHLIFADGDYVSMQQSGMLE